MSGIASDLRYGMRMLLKRKGTSTLAIVALALGIGLTTTMFSIINGAILRGLPFPDSHRLMDVARAPLAQPDNRQNVSSDDFLDWRDRQQVFSEIAAFSNTTVIVSGPDGAERYRAARVTANMFTVLRMPPAKGRAFQPADDQPGAPNVAIISHRVWENQFRSDPNVLGQTLRINGQPTEVVGVMPVGFAFPETEDVWLPARPVRSAVRSTDGSHEVIARLKDGVSQGEATTAMKTIAAQLEAEFGKNRPAGGTQLELRDGSGSVITGFTATVGPFVQQFIGRDVVSTLFTMLGAVFGVLLIACANVMNLQLARAVERTKEIAIRSALGGERLRIIRQLFVEGLLLSAIGAVLGLAIAQVGVTLFNAGISGTNPPFWIDIRLDGTVLLFASAMTVAAALASSVLPAFRATRTGANDVLKDQSRGTTSLRAGVLTRVLVGGSVMLSSALLIVSGLMIKSIIEVGRARYGFQSEQVLMARTILDETKYKTDGAIQEFVDRLTVQLRGVAGVRHVSMATGEPPRGPRYYLTKEGQTFEKPEEGPTVQRVAATPAMFDVLNIKAIEGRLLGPGDIAGAVPVTVITKDLADRHFKGESPLGRRIKLGLKPRIPLWTIVGVVPALLTRSVNDDQDFSTAYVPLAQSPERNLSLLVATNADPLVSAPGLRRAVRDIDQDVPTFIVDSLSRRLAQQGWPYRVFGSLFFAFGVSALIMAVAGLYGVLAFTVRLRTSEIGVRMALGADGPRIARMFVRQGMTVVVVGLAIGVAIGALLSPLMSELFFNVTPRDPMVYGIAITVLLATGLTASLVPALRAAKVDPLDALRES